MKKELIAGIIVGIVISIIILSGILISSQKSNVIEVGDALDKKINQETKTPEIQAKLDEIENKTKENNYTPKEREWITSGPFQIDRSEYLLGEKIFLRVGSLNPTEKGQVAFLRPLNETHYSVYITIPFDGAAKDAFNYYISPQISKINGLCSANDIIGQWTVVFRGTEYENLKFNIINETLPGDEDKFSEKVC